jgi:TPR repeat protein
VSARQCSDRLQSAAIAYSVTNLARPSLPCSDLGLLYLNGYRVDKDPAKAAEGFEKAANMRT